MGLPGAIVIPVIDDGSVRVAAERTRIDGWSLVLEALAIPHEIASVDGLWVIRVSPEDKERALAALAAHDREAEEDEIPESLPLDHGRSFGGVVLAGALLVFFFFTGERGSAAGARWFHAGSAVAEKILGGEIWRTATALTLHADAGHVLGNAVALIVFGSALCRWLGVGLASVSLLVSGVLGNFITALVYGSHHNSVGASTAVFGGLGVLGGLQFLRRFGHRRRVDWRRRSVAVLAACLGLFAMLGVGERTDVVAHLAGLASGIPLGVGLGRMISKPIGWWGQIALLAIASTLVAGAWYVALM